MSIRTISNILVLGSLCLTLNLSRQAKLALPASNPSAPVTASPSISEGLLIGKYSLSKFFDEEHLELKPGHRFSYEETVCNGVFSTNQGTWEQQGDTVILHPENNSSKSLNLRFIPVTWKGQLFLIDENEMPSFCHSRFSRDSFGDYGHYIRKLSPGSKIHIPIPHQFQDFLEHGAVVVRVASVDSEKIATLEGASVTRLQPGMHLCWKGSRGSGKCELRITEVGPDFARARQVSIYSPYDSRVRPGELFTTGGGRDTPVGTSRIDE